MLASIRLHLSDIEAFVSTLKERSSEVFKETRANQIFCRNSEFSLCVPCMKRSYVLVLKCPCCYYLEFHC